MSEKENQEEKKSSPLFLIKSKNSTNDKIKNTKFLGFFLKISDEYLPFERCLMTIYPALNENDIKTKKEIKIESNGSERIIDMTKERKIFSSKTLNYICIEIFEEEDNIVYDNFLKIDSDILEKNQIILMIKKYIYLNIQNILYLQEKYYLQKKIE